MKNGDGRFTYTSIHCLIPGSRYDYNAFRHLESMDLRSANDSECGVVHFHEVQSKLCILNSAIPSNIHYKSGTVQQWVALSHCYNGWGPIIF